MPGQWVDVGARRLIDVTAVDPRGPTCRPACECSFRSADRFGLRRGRGRNVGGLCFCRCSWVAGWGKLYGPLGWAVTAYIAIWTGLFTGHLWRYRASGFRDDDWLARHDHSDPGGAVFLELGPTSGANLNSGGDLELWVKSHGTWEVVDYDEVVLMPDKVIRCRFDLNHEVFPIGFMTSVGSAPTSEASSLKSPASGSNCGIIRSAAGHDLHRRPIEAWLPKRCRSARTRSSHGGWLPKRWPAGGLVRGER
jgi:hypothetical protein